MYDAFWFIADFCAMATDRKTLVALLQALPENHFSDDQRSALRARFSFLVSKYKNIYYYAPANCHNWVALFVEHMTRARLVIYDIGSKIERDICELGDVARYNYPLRWSPDDQWILLGSDSIYWLARGYLTSILSHTPLWTSIPRISPCSEYIYFIDPCSGRDTVLNIAQNKTMEWPRTPVDATIRDLQWLSSNKSLRRLCVERTPIITFVPTMQVLDLQTGSSYREPVDENSILKEDFASHVSPVVGKTRIAYSTHRWGVQVFATENQTMPLAIFCSEITQPVVGWSRDESRLIIGGYHHCGQWSHDDQLVFWIEDSRLRAIRSAALRHVEGTPFCWIANES